MTPEVLEYLAPVVGIISIGTFILIGMRMRLTAKLRAQDQLPREEVERLGDAVEYLNDQVRTMGEEPQLPPPSSPTGDSHQNDAAAGFDEMCCASPVLRMHRRHFILDADV